MCETVTTPLWVHCDRNHRTKNVNSGHLRQILCVSPKGGVKGVCLHRGGRRMRGGTTPAALRAGVYMPPSSLSAGRKS
ncbi:hypothetical protein TNIN_462431 [Trichonephila inaurata madagascariensis]|uniref:Uncharacterized protein n=1 Tax=Trichonephila inaurata madagascariensis TaxID=2747483 RepID=A0A8X6YPC9_9ARAC|nr:hypothetical protein TNIN_462431 [Trichonephila inaurata madagascariensis]